MRIAIGSKSALYVKEESSFGVMPSGNHEQLDFNTESLGARINTIISQAIKPDRTVGSVRGGNIMLDGSMTMDFYSERLGLLFNHMLGGSIVTTTISVGALAVGEITRGTYVSHDGNV